MGQTPGDWVGESICHCSVDRPTDRVAVGMREAAESSIAHINRIFWPDKEGEGKKKIDKMHLWKEIYKSV